MQENGKNRKPTITLLVLGQKAGPPKRIEISRRLLTGAAIAGALVFIAIAIGAIDYVANKFEIKKMQAERRLLLLQNSRLSERGREKDQQLAALSDKIRAVELTLERIEEMEGSVRILSGMPSSTRPLISSGGPVQDRLSGRVGLHDIAKMHESVTDVIDRMGIQRASLVRMTRYFAERRSEILQIPNAWPCRGWVTSLFGPRISPFTGQLQMHNGLDIAAPEGTVIRAPAAGMAMFVGSKGGYGNILIMRHGRGITTHYGHLYRSLISEGLSVPSGAPIALVGNTGRSTGPHLHYEVRINNIPVNPKRFLPEEKTEEENQT